MSPRKEARVRLVILIVVLVVGAAVFLADKPIADAYNVTSLEKKTTVEFGNVINSEPAAGSSAKLASST